MDTVAKLPAPPYLIACADSRIGGRTENQDSYGWADTPFGYVVTVCDGMGGGPGGKTASSIAVREILAGISEGNRDETPANAILKAITRANSAILQAAQENPELTGMGSTCTVLLLTEENAMAAHVGDSRIYQIRGKKKVFRTFDHSLVFELVKQKIITEEQARTSPQSNIITRGLGLSEDVEAEIVTLGYKAGDRFMLTSDGIHGVVPENELIELASDRKENLETITDDIADLMDEKGKIKGGKHDNLTIAMIETTTDSAYKPRKSLWNKLKGIFTILTALLAFATANAKIAIWTVEPAYDQLVRYTGSTYLFKSNGKWGIMDTSGKTILPAKYDVVTDFTNGYALACTKSGVDYVLDCIISLDGTVTTLRERYILPKLGRYFSEGKLAVANTRGEFGYINPAGNIVVRCQFDDALPFKEGWAPVKQGSYAKYINESYDTNATRGTMVVDFHYGEMTMAGCFSRGTTPVAYNKDYALIDLRGKKVKGLGEWEFLDLYKASVTPPESWNNGVQTTSEYTEFTEGSKKGLATGGTKVVPARFDGFGEKYADGDIIAIAEGKQGILRIMDGDVALSTRVEGKNSSTIEIDRNNNPQPITIECELPAAVQDYRIVMMEGGKQTDITSNFRRSGNLATATVTPQIPKDAQTYHMEIEVEGNGFPLLSEERTFSVSYPVRLRVSAPGPSTVRANQNNNATVSATIHNDSAKAVTVSYTWSNGASGTATIPANGSKTVSTTLSGTSQYTKTMSISLSTGERSSNTITFIPFL